MFSSFMVSGLIFRSLIHFIFLYDVKEYWTFILLQVAIQFSQKYLLKRLSFLHFILLPIQFSQKHLLKRLSFLHCIFLPPLS